MGRSNVGGEAGGNSPNGLPPRGARRPSVIVELLEPDNAELLGRSRGEVIVSPLIVSHMLAQVALRRELRVVVEEAKPGSRYTDLAISEIVVRFRSPPIALFQKQCESPVYPNAVQAIRHSGARVGAMAGSSAARLCDETRSTFMAQITVSSPSICMRVKE